jgi:hypothetical protein
VEKEKEGCRRRKRTKERQTERQKEIQTEGETKKTQEERWR